MSKQSALTTIYRAAREAGYFHIARRTMDDLHAVVDAAEAHGPTSPQVQAAAADLSDEAKGWLRRGLRDWPEVGDGA